jgi:hypothetical protein
MLGTHNAVYAQSCDVRPLPNLLRVLLSHPIHDKILTTSQELHPTAPPRAHRPEQLMAKEEDSWSVLRRDRHSQQTRICRTAAVERNGQCVVLHLDRKGGTESHGTDYELAGVPVYSLGRVVGGEEGYKQR